ncbi:alpha/beta hydrolase [Arenibacter latericius]|uniref:alpha/beta hydrolase n=1 Tax=Arenibacter latericius TaxID=86104 RepID=UPI000401FCF0|nr:alpha/beta hydrolase-fold protein [Arenibacter latericius]MDX1363747.1 alpha/beta hydrolase-fold protein [Arenibacter latericius]
MLRILTLIALLLGMGTNAQATLEVFESIKLQEKRDVSYYIPETYDKKEKYTLILVLDAEYLFDQVVANAKFYSKFHGMPEAIVIGVNQSNYNLRYQDCAFEPYDGLPSERGKLFFEFLGMELIPYIESKYNTTPFKMFVGYDITANFGNFYLYKEESLFNAYVSISPTLAPEMTTRIPDRLAAMNKKIFYQLILEGEQEENASDILALNKSLQEIDSENLYYFFDEYPNADHISVATYGIGKAFDNIFGMFKPISPKEYREKILTSNEPVFKYLEDKQNYISELFGFNNTTSLNDIMAIYAASRKKGDFESLKPLSALCKKEYPETMLGFYFEAEYYEQLGEPKKALRTFEKSFAMSEIDFLTKDMALEKIRALKADFGY